jgi:hypothetical protein
VKVTDVMQVWATAINVRIAEELVDLALIPHLRTLQCMYYIYGIIALGRRAT